MSMRSRSATAAVKDTPDGNLPSPDGSDGCIYNGTIKHKSKIQRKICEVQPWSIPKFPGASGSELTPVIAAGNARNRPKPNPERRQWFQRRKPGPIRRINCRAKVPGTDLTMYAYKGRIYHCPPGIKPWVPLNRWMLEPRRKLFQQFNSGVPYVDHKVYHYVADDPFLSDSGLGFAAKKRREA